MWLFGEKYNKPLSIITDKAIHRYRNCCNGGIDDIELATNKINRINDLGEIVYRFNDDSEHYLIQYFNMVLEVNNTIAINIYRDIYNKPNRIKYSRYKKWNDTHGIIGERKW